MPSSIRFRCPGCNARIRAPYQLLGQERNCPQCGKRLTVRVTVPEDSGVLVLNDVLPTAPHGRARSRF
jgi:uncharacterized paraquat-inducible protein A